MSRAVRLSTPTVVFALLAVIAAGAAGASAKPGKSGAVGGTLNVDLFTDVDFTDPALDYISTGWEIEYSTCLKLMNYPDANGAAGLAARSRGRRGLPARLERAARRTTSTSRPASRSSRTASGRHRRDLQGRDRPRLRTRRCSRRRRRSSATSSARSSRRQGRPVSGVKVQGLAPARHADASRRPDFLARIAMPFFCAVPTNLPHRPERRRHARLGGAVLHRRSRSANKSIVLKRNPNYKGKRPHNVDQIVYTIGNSLEATLLRVE